MSKPCGRKGAKDWLFHTSERNELPVEQKLLPSCTVQIGTRPLIWQQESRVEKRLPSFPPADFFVDRFFSPGRKSSYSPRKRLVCPQSRYCSRYSSLTCRLISFRMKSQSRISPQCCKRPVDKEQLANGHLLQFS